MSLRHTIFLHLFKLTVFNQLTNLFV